MTRRLRVIRTSSRGSTILDRIACPWLIRRFIDSEATFLFVPTDQVFDPSTCGGHVAAAPVARSSPR
jgi:hypothetical protein